MKKKILSLILTVAMLLTVMPMALAADEYSDVQGHWGEAAIDRWTQAGVAVGREDGTFAPDAPMTRGEAAQVLANLLRLTKEANISQYGDMDPSSSYYTAMAQCVAAGIFNGTSDTTMSPDSELTREQLFTIFARALGVQPMSSSSVIFADSDKVSDWALGYINALAELGAVRGVGNSELQPQADINRASVMSLLDQTISVYADTNGATVGESSGIVLVVADQVNVMGNVENLVVAGGSASVTSGSVTNASLVGNATVSVSGSVTMNAVVVSGEGASLNVSGQATVGSVAVAASATGASVEVTGSATVNTVATQANSVTISGDGTVNSAVVSGSNTIVNTTGTNLTVSAGTTGVTQNGSAVSGGSSVETTPSTPGTSGGSGTTTPSNPTTPPVYIPNFYSVSFVDVNGTPISNYTAMEYSAVQFPTVAVADGQKVTWYENRALLTDTSSVIVTSNRTFTAVVGSDKFTAGNGTQQYPYLISSAAELSELLVGSASNIIYYRLNNNIDLSSSVDVGATYLVNAVFDGAGYQLYTSTQNSLNGVFKFVYGTTTIKNLTYNLSNLNNAAWAKDCVPLVYQVSGACNVTIESVKITGTHSVDSNNGPFVMNEFMIRGSSLTFNNCEYAAFMQGSGYNSCFVGWQGAEYTDAIQTHQCAGTIAFNGCSITGEMVCENAAVFVANGSNAYKRTYTFSSNSITGTVRGTEVSGYFTAVALKSGYSFETDAANSCGGADDTKVYVGATDSTLGISNDNGTLTITPSNNNSVTSYVVEVGIYTTLYKGGEKSGTWKFIVRQKIPASDNMTADIKNTGFVDYEYCTANGIAITQDTLGNSVAEINGVTYYVVKDYIDEAGNQGYVGSPANPGYRNATIIRVSAYVGDTLYSSAVLK